jgi:hypothetical protein
MGVGVEQKDHFQKKKVLNVSFRIEVYVKVPVQFSRVSQCVFTIFLIFLLHFTFMLGIVIGLYFLLFL